VNVRLSQLRTLTPDDFATVVHQASALWTRYDAEQLLGALEAECRAKMSEEKHVRGFVGGQDLSCHPVRLKACDTPSLKFCLLA
jgi:hypothetical protein